MQIIQILLYILQGMIALGTVIVVCSVALALNNGDRDRGRVSTFLTHAIVALIGTLAVLITMLVLIYHFKLT